MAAKASKTLRANTGKQTFVKVTRNDINFEGIFEITPKEAYPHHIY